MISKQLFLTLYISLVAQSAFSQELVGRVSFHNKRAAVRLKRSVEIRDCFRKQDILTVKASDSLHEVVLIKEERAIPIAERWVNKIERAYGDFPTESVPELLCSKEWRCVASFNYDEEWSEIQEISMMPNYVVYGGSTERYSFSSNGVVIRCVEPEYDDSIIRKEGEWSYDPASRKLVIRWQGQEEILSFSLFAVSETLMAWREEHLWKTPSSGCENKTYTLLVFNI